jgi:hypothetical protein
MSFDKETIDVLMILAILGYGIFLGYCAGRAKGYEEGADMVKEIYTRK